MSINSTWNSFSTTDQQQQIMNTLGLSELPDPTTLSESQLNAIDSVLGSGTSVQIIASYKLSDLEEKLKDTASNPDLDPPNLGDASGLISILMQLREKIGKLMLGSASEGVKINKEKLQNVNEEKMAKLKEMVEKLQTAEGWNIAGKVLGWAGSIAGAVIGAVVCVACIGLGIAAICTGVGAGIGIGLIVAGLCAGAGCVLSIGGIGMMIADETKLSDKIYDELAPSLYPAYKDLIAILPPDIQHLLKEYGLDGKDGVKMLMKLGVSGAFALASLGIGAVGLIAGIATGGASTAATAATTAATVASTVAQTVVNILRQIVAAVQALVQLAMAGVQITTAAVNITGEVKNFEVTQTKAESKEFQAFLIKLQAMMEDEQEALKKAYEALNNDLAVCSEMLEDVFKTKSSFLGGHTGAV